MFFVIKFVKLVTLVWVGFCGVPHVRLQMKELTTDPIHGKYPMHNACYLPHQFVASGKQRTLIKTAVSFNVTVYSFFSSTQWR
jgi:hypothetical protein